MLLVTRSATSQLGEKGVLDEVRHPASTSFPTTHSSNNTTMEGSVTNRSRDLLAQHVASIHASRGSGLDGGRGLVTNDVDLIVAPVETPRRYADNGRQGARTRELEKTKLVRWPGLKVMKDRCSDPWRLEILGYLGTHFYGPLSMAVHVKATGMLAQTGHLLPGASEDNQKAYFSQQFAIAFAMLIALVCVVALDVIQTGAFATRVVEFCQRDGLPDVAREVYDRCFKAKLAAMAT